jgi:hypothetical protein
VTGLNTQKQSTASQSKSTPAAKKKGSIEHATYLTGTMLLMTTKLHLTRGSWEFTHEHFQECYDEVVDKYTAVTKGATNAK